MDIKTPIIGIITLFIIALFIIVILTNIIDISNHNNAIAKEKKQHNANPNMFYNKGVNYKMFSYMKNSIGAEPYLIYFRQNITSIMFLTIFSLVGVLGIGVLYVIVRYIIKQNKGDQNPQGNNSVSINVDVLRRFYQQNMTDIPPALVTMFVICIILLLSMPFIYNHFYNKEFLGNVHNIINKNIIDVNNLSTAIYDNITRDDKFLENVVKNNIDECINIINRQGSNYSRIGSMIFTLSLYNNYKASSDEPDFIDVKEIFTVIQLSEREKSPAVYLTNKQPRYIHNLMSSIEELLSDVLITEKQRKLVKDDVARRINNINELISATLVRRPSAESVINYLSKEIGINMIPTVLLLGGALYSIRDKLKIIKVK